MPPKFDVIAAAAMEVNVEQDRHRFLLANLKTHTNVCYLTYWHMIEKYMGLQQPPTDIVTKELFCKLISATAAQKICNGKMLRSSLLFYQKVGLAKGGIWANDSDIISYVNGAYTIAHEGKRPRGSINEELFTELMQWLPDQEVVFDYPDIPDAYALMYTIGMRYSQFAEFQLGDMITSGGKIYAILRKDKRAKKGQNEVHYKELVHTQVSFLQDLFEARANTPAGPRTKGSILFTKHEAPIAQMRELIHKAAIALGWPPGLEFDGPHCFRHGFVSEAISDNLRSRCQQSAPTIKRYAKSNLSRLNQA